MYYTYSQLGERWNMINVGPLGQLGSHIIPRFQDMSLQCYSSSPEPENAIGWKRKFEVLEAQAAVAQSKSKG